MKTVLQQAVDHYGPESQLVKLAEEAAELTAALLQFLQPSYRDRDQAYRNVLEELDDVEICLQQARIIFKHQRPYRNQKLARLANRLPAPSLYPGLVVLTPGGARKTVAEVYYNLAATNDDVIYNQDPDAEDFQPLVPYEEKT